MKKFIKNCELCGIPIQTKHQEVLHKQMRHKNSLEAFFEELERIRDFHPSSPEFAKLLSKYDLPFSTIEAIRILKRIS